MEISNILSFIKKSKITLIGYSSFGEGIIGDIISRIPHIYADDIDSFIREEKINTIIGEPSLDINILIYMANKPLGDREKIKYCLMELRKTCPYNIIILNHVYKNPFGSKTDNIAYFAGGNEMLYAADFAMFIDEKCTIVKNRHSSNLHPLFHHDDII
jgi:hypothetical protein